MEVFFRVGSGPVRGRDDGTGRDIISVDFCTWADTLETCCNWRIYSQALFYDGKEIRKVLSCVTIDRCGL
jgi:hypothetical protein